MNTNNFLQTPIQFLKGVGPKVSAHFEKKGIRSVEDLLYFFPRDYQDRSKIFQVAECIDGQKALLRVRVQSQRMIRTRYGKRIFEVQTSDHSGNLILKYFNPYPSIEKSYTSGQEVLLFGVVRSSGIRKEIFHPQILKESQEGREFGALIPIYTELDGLSTKFLRKTMSTALSQPPEAYPDDLPRYLLDQYKFPSLLESLKEIHFPQKNNVNILKDFSTPEQTRLIFEEFFKFQYFLTLQKLQTKKENAFAFSMEQSIAIVKKKEKLLPFSLTNDQKKSIQDILTDLSRPHPMNRLLQGDVGSGKTAVSLLTAAAVLEQGKQVCLLAPTEILARQHFRQAQKLSENSFKVFLLSGSSTKKEREEILQALQEPAPLFLVSTHAVFEDDVQFSELDYVLIDEQHRFGVDQRRSLRSKGRNRIPHCLVLTATPIPRTLALTVYGDLEVSSIRELPPGRTPVKTHVVKSDWNQKLYQKIRDEIQKGRQAYFVCPLVEDSEAEGFEKIESATTLHEKLKKDIFPNLQIGLLHGQQKFDEKNKIMSQFSANEIQILVSTTVVEVGVDVPNATMMIIENAERFGLSQLHQLRGRVGRGQYESYCFLKTHTHVSDQSYQRLKIMEKTQDGFEISEADLEFRGPGEFLGIKQSGELPFKIGDIVRDRDILLQARDESLKLIQKKEKLDPRFESYLQTRGKIEFERLKTS